jgi:hypothetical protein
LNQAYEILRLSDIVLYLIILAGFWRHRETFLTANSRLRMLLVGLGLLIGTGLYSAIEILILEVPGGPRTFVSPVPLIFLAVSLHLDLLARTGRRITGKKSTRDV